MCCGRLHFATNCRSRMKKEHEPKVSDRQDKSHNIVSCLTLEKISCAEPSRHLEIGCWSVRIGNPLCSCFMALAAIFFLMLSFHHPPTLGHFRKFCQAFFRCFSCAYSSKAFLCFHFFAISSANKNKKKERDQYFWNGMHLRQGANIFISG